MNGLINCNILFYANCPTADSFFADLASWKFRVSARGYGSTKGYVSRVPGREPLAVGFSSRYNLWYVLIPRYDTTLYCNRLYFQLKDDLTGLIVKPSPENVRLLEDLFG